MRRCWRWSGGVVSRGRGGGRCGGGLGKRVSRSAEPRGKDKIPESQQGDFHEEHFWIGERMEGMELKRTATEDD